MQKTGEPGNLVPRKYFNLQKIFDNPTNIFIQVKFHIHKNNLCSKLLLSALLAEIFFCPENFLCKLLAEIYYCIFFCTELIAEIFFWTENFLCKLLAEIYCCIFFCTELIAEIFFWIENFLCKLLAEIYKHLCSRKCNFVQKRLFVCPKNVHHLICPRVLPPKIVEIVEFWTILSHFRMSNSKIFFSHGKRFRLSKNVIFGLF